MLSSGRGYGSGEERRTSEESAVGAEPEPSVSAKVAGSTSMDWDLRVQYFIGFFILSIIAGFLGSSLLVNMKLTGFAVLTSISSILSLVGTFFLSGPTTQVKRMFDNSRWIASLMYIGSIAMTLISGLVLVNPPLAIVFVVAQYISMAWYSLSYIPYARQLISRVLCSCL